MWLLVEFYNNYFNSICYIQIIYMFDLVKFFFYLIMNFVDIVDDIKLMREFLIIELKKSN